MPHPPPNPTGTLCAPVIRHAAGEWGRGDDSLAVEEPLEIRLEHGPEGERRHNLLAITMRTPGQDEELAAGWLLAEGVLQAPADIQALISSGEVQPGGFRNGVRAVLAPSVRVDLDRLARHTPTTSACGVCGRTTLEGLLAHRDPLGVKWTIPAALLTALPMALREAQTLFGATGGIHAAALFDLEGHLLCVREDVGRHNALDKLIGAQFLWGNLPLERRLLLLSGRASFELLQKAFAAGIGLVAAVGAPSSLAATVAQRCGITLVGWLRGERFSVYTHPARVAGAPDWHPAPVDPAPSPTPPRRNA